MLPVDTNIKDAYANGVDVEQQFIQDLALFLCVYLKDHGALVEKRELNELLLKVKTSLYSDLLIVLLFDERNLFSYRPFITCC